MSFKDLIDIQRYNVISDSMAPLIKEGDTICVKLFPEDVKIGDIITFKCLGSLCVHRIVLRKREKEGIGYITKGDFSLDFDNEAKGIYLNDIIGKVVSVKGRDKVLVLNNRVVQLFNYIIAFFSAFEAVLFRSVKKIKAFIITKRLDKRFSPILMLYKRFFVFAPFICNQFLSKNRRPIWTRKTF